MRLAIRGVGAVGAFGASVAELRAALRGEVPRPEPRDGALRGSTDRLTAFVPAKSLRRIDHFSRLALLGAHLALEDAGPSDVPGSRTGTVIASGYGASATTFAFLDSVIDGGDIGASPTHFSNSVHNAAAAHASILLGLTGPSLTVSQFELSAASALLSAGRWLAEGRVDRVLFGAVDEHCGVLGHCRERYFGPPPAGMSPLDLGRQTAVAGEGAAFLVLTRDEGEPPACGYVEAVEVGRGSVRSPGDRGDGPLVVLGADGHRRCGRRYARAVPEGSTVAAYAPLWGATPMAAGFDLVAAALMLREGEAFASPVPPAEATPWRLAAAGEPLRGRGVCCLKLAADGGFGLVTLRGPRP